MIQWSLFPFLQHFGVLISNSFNLVLIFLSSPPAPSLSLSFLRSLYRLWSTIFPAQRSLEYGTPTPGWFLSRCYVMKSHVILTIILIAIEISTSVQFITPIEYGSLKRFPFWYCGSYVLVMSLLFSCVVLKHYDIFQFLV